MNEPVGTDRWERLRELFELAEEQPSAERARFLDRACAGEPELRRELESLLRAEAATRDRLAEVVEAAARDAGGEPGPFSPGKVLGERYEIRAPIGSGGMGEVWRAFDLKLRVEVALKSLRPEYFESEKRRELLRAEVRSAREVVSPNVCRVFDLIVEDGQELVSMEYVDGQTLVDVLRERGPLTLHEAGEIVSQFLAGLEAVHVAGLVHRDFKPENVMLTRAGRAVLLDFGVAKSVTSDSDTVAGTPAYMSPEQLRGETLDARSDIFSVGVVLAEMVSGEAVKERSSRHRLWRELHEDPPKVPASPWARVIRKALSRAREDRYESAQALSRALEKVTLRAEGAEEKRPYPGLASFKEENSEHFFGREAEVEAMLRKLGRARLLAIAGPSGAGKSSFVRAGLAPVLAEGWRHLVFHPGDRPFSALAQALLPELSGDTEAVAELLRIEDTDAAISVVRRWRKRHSQTLLIADQFEELFAQNPPEVQARFAELLARLPIEADTHVLLSLRDDFLIHCHDHPQLAPILSELTLLKAPTGPALRRALVQPALVCGYRFEDDDLVDEMLSAVSDERGALPLLAFAASQLWERRDRDEGVLTREAYEQLGGVGGALAQHAEATLAKIGLGHEDVVREIFRNLVTAQGTRAARDRAELLSVFDDEKGASDVLDVLVDARLLTSFEVERADDEPPHNRIEIVHESLLAAWPRLVRWQTQDADGAQLRDQLRQAAQVWDERERRDDLLWTGTAVDEFRLWRERYPGGLSETEESFAGAMVTRVERNRRRKRLAVAAAFILLAGVTGVTTALWDRSEAARRQAADQALRAEASKLLALAQARLEEDPTEALAFTTASLELSDTPHARVSALRALWQAPPVFELAADGLNPKIPVFSPQGRWLAAPGHTENIGVWAETGERVALLPGHSAGQNWNLASWDQDGVLVTGRFFGDRAHLWSIPGGERLSSLDFGGPSWWQVLQGQLFAATFDATTPPDQKKLTLRSWVLPKGEARQLGRFDVQAMGAANPLFQFAPKGAGWLYVVRDTVYRRRLPLGAGPAEPLTRHPTDVSFFGTPPGHDNPVYSIDRGGEIRVFDFANSGRPGVEVITRPETAPEHRELDPTGRWLVNIAEREARLWDRWGWPTARPLVLRRSSSWYASVAGFHPSGGWLAASTDHMSNLTFWPLRRGYPKVVDGYQSLMRPLAFSPDSRLLATNWSDGLRLWPVGEGMGKAPRPLPGRGHRTNLTFGPRGRFLVGTNFGGFAEIVPLDGSIPRRLEGFTPESALFAPAISPSGRRVAAAFGFGSAEQKVMRVWDLETGEVQVLELPANGTAAQPADGSGPGLTGYESQVTGAAFADESTLYTAGDGGIRRWTLDTGSHELVFPLERRHSAFMHCDREARTAVVARTRWNDESYCRPVELVDLETGRARTLPAFGECVSFSAAALDTSGTVVATGGFDGEIRVGRVNDEEPHRLLGHEGRVDRVAISPDLRWVASTGEDNTLRLWPMPDLDAPPLQALPGDELIAKLKSLTNLRAVRASEAPSGWMIELDRFPGWKEAPTW